MYVKRLSTLTQIICLAIILNRTQAKRNQIVASINKIECPIYKAEIIKNLSCYVNQTSPSTGAFSVEVSVTEDLHDIKGHYTLSIKRGSLISEMISTKMDFCKILASLQTDYLLRMFTAEVRRVSNIPLECPIKKNKLYYIRGFSLDTKLFPSYIPKLDFISDTLLNHKNNKGVGAIVYGSLDRN